MSLKQIYKFRLKLDVMWLNLAVLLTPIHVIGFEYKLSCNNQAQMINFEIKKN